MIMVVVTVLLLLIIISLTRVGRRQPDHIYDRHDSADPRGPAWAARGSAVDEADRVRRGGSVKARRMSGLPRSDNEMLRRVGIHVLNERWESLGDLYLPLVRPQPLPVPHVD